jgi:hypothetical protein
VLLAGWAQGPAKTHQRDVELRSASAIVGEARVLMASQDLYDNYFLESAAWQAARG